MTFYKEYRNFWVSARWAHYNEKSDHEANNKQKTDYTDAA